MNVVEPGQRLRRLPSPYAKLKPEALVNDGAISAIHATVQREDTLAQCVATVAQSSVPPPVQRIQNACQRGGRCGAEVHRPALAL